MQNKRNALAIFLRGCNRFKSVHFNAYKGITIFNFQKK